MTAPVASNRHGPTAKLVDSAGFVEIAMAWTTASMRSFAT
jgi:hypothetical protein